MIQLPKEVNFLKDIPEGVAEKANACKIAKFERVVISRFKDAETEKFRYRWDVFGMVGNKKEAIADMRVQLAQGGMQEYFILRKNKKCTDGQTYLKYLESLAPKKASKPKSSSKQKTKRVKVTAKKTAPKKIQAPRKRPA